MRATPLILFLAFFLGLAACDRTLLHRQESFVFGTRVEILIAGEDESAARAAASAVLKELDRLHRTYHAWEPSELSELNQALAAGHSREVSPELAALLSDAQGRSAQGGALFDPGIGRLVRLWGFHSDEFKPVLPDPGKIAAWRASRPGMSDLAIRGSTVTSKNPDVLIDLGGYLKGVALDRALSLLRERNIRNALVNIGGNLGALGTRNGTPWRVGIQHPRRPAPLATLDLREGEAIGTSGDYQRYFDLDGQRYCHLLDPRTGAPVGHTRAVTVLIPPRKNAGTQSDAASKPLFIAGASWPEFAEKMELTHVLRIDASGHLQVSAAFLERLSFEEKPSSMSVIPLPRKTP